MLDILWLISKVEPLEELMQKVVDTIAEAFNMKRVILGALDEKTGMFYPKALHGYTADQALAIKRNGYTLERMKGDLAERFRIGRRCYYIRAEDQYVWHDDDDVYILNPEKVDVPRESPSDWHELDYIDFVMTDRLGNWIGWLEINEPGDGKVPSKGVLDRIQILSDLTGIAIENAKMYEEVVSAMKDAQGYLDLIVHDIGNMIDPLVYYANSLALAIGLDERGVADARNVISSAKSIRTPVDNVRKLSELKNSEPIALETVDIKGVLHDCISALKRDFPSRDIAVSFECPDVVSPVLADDLIKDLFMNLLSNAVKYTRRKQVEVDLRVTEGHSAYTIRIEDRGQGIPDGKKEQIFERFSPRPEGFAGTGLGLSVVNLLVKRYNGLISVRDRVPGDWTQGTCFEVSLPKLLRSESDSGIGSHGGTDMLSDSGSSQNHLDRK
ncbi:MAG: sensor histidine kinase [Thermoplasmata archaeon]